MPHHFFWASSYSQRCFFGAVKLWFFVSFPIISVKYVTMSHDTFRGDVSSDIDSLTAFFFYRHFKGRRPSRMWMWTIQELQVNRVDLAALYIKLLSLWPSKTGAWLSKRHVFNSRCVIFVRNRKDLKPQHTPKFKSSIFQATKRLQLLFISTLWIINHKRTCFVDFYLFVIKTNHQPRRWMELNL